MKNTFKLLSVALVMTMATHSFSMHRLRRFATNAKATISTRLAPLRVSANNLFARSAIRETTGSNASKATTAQARPVISRLAARKMLYASAAGLASVASVASTAGAAAGSVSTVEAQKTMAAIQEGSRAPVREWTPEEMQAKVDELRAVENNAASNQTTQVADPRDYPSLNVAVEVDADYTVRSVEEMQRLHFMQNHAALWAKCLSRELTEANNKPTENETDCAQLWSKYVASCKNESDASKKYNGRNFRNASSASAGLSSFIDDMQVPTMKADVSFEFALPDSVALNDLNTINTKGINVGYKGKTNIVFPYANRMIIPDFIRFALPEPREKVQAFSFNSSMPFSVENWNYKRVNVSGTIEGAMQDANDQPNKDAQTLSPEQQVELLKQRCPNGYGRSKRGFVCI